MLFRADRVNTPLQSLKATTSPNNRIARVNRLLSANRKLHTVYWYAFFKTVEIGSYYTLKTDAACSTDELAVIMSTAPTGNSDPDTA